MNSELEKIISDKNYFYIFSKDKIITILKQIFYEIINIKYKKTEYIPPNPLTEHIGFKEEKMFDRNGKCIGIKLRKYDWRKKIEEIKEEDEKLGKKRIKRKKNLLNYALENNMEYILDDWNYENNELLPEEIGSQSEKKIMWKLIYYCFETGYHIFEWQSSSAAKITGAECPFLNNREIRQEYNDLQTYAKNNNMEYLLKEWDYEANDELLPSQIGYKDSYKKIWWKIYEKHPITNKLIELKWTATIYDRTINKFNCPYLTGHKVYSGFNDLNTLRQDIVKEWNYEKNGDLTPKQVSIGSNKSVYWKCSKCGHEWKAKIYERVNRGYACPECAKSSQTSFPEYAIMYYLQKYVKNIEHSYKELGFELDIYLPDLRIGIEYDGSYWHKEKIKNDLIKNKKCKELNIQLYRFRENLDSLNDDSIDILCTENTKSLNVSIKQLIQNMFNENLNVNVDRDRFKIEENRHFLVSKNSLKIKSPQLAKELHPTKNGNLTAENISCCSRNPVWWLCPICGYEWQATPDNRYGKGTGCKNCYETKKRKNKEKIAQSRIGETNIANNGMEMWITDYRTNKDIDVKFSDGYEAFHVRYDKFKLGKIKNPNVR